MKMYDVTYKQVYDLYYKASHQDLRYRDKKNPEKFYSIAYVLEFSDWIKAGVGFNTRGFAMPSRSIAYFTKIYHLVIEHADDLDYLRENINDLRIALCRYYQDIFDLYQEFLEASTKRKRKNGSKDSGLEFVTHTLLILPSFKNTPVMVDLFSEIEGGILEVPWDKYVPQHKEEFDDIIRSPYVVQNPKLYGNMGLLYDYGVHRDAKGIILDVKLWDNPESL